MISGPDQLAPAIIDLDRAFAFHTGPLGLCAVAK